MLIYLQCTGCNSAILNRKVIDLITVNELNLTIKKQTILNNISINFEKGKIHGLIGRNGSGKTMLMKCICGFVRPTSGTIIVADKQIGKSGSADS